MYDKSCGFQNEKDLNFSTDGLYCSLLEQSNIAIGLSGLRFHNLYVFLLPPLALAECFADIIPYV